MWAGAFYNERASRLVQCTFSGHITVGVSVEGRASPTSAPARERVELCIWRGGTVGLIETLISSNSTARRNRLDVRIGHFSGMAGSAGLGHLH